MSRIGKLPIVIPAGVEIKIVANNITVKGALGVLNLTFKTEIKVVVENNQIIVTRSNDVKEVRALHGLYRKLIANMVEGVTKGYTKHLIVNGVGYKVALAGNKITINCGYSHPIECVAPEGVKFEVPTQTEILVKGIDKALVGQIAANIKAYKKPDPYHAYGIRLKEDVVVRKEGKTGKK